MTVLGTDASLDAVPGTDVTELAVGTEGDVLHLRFTLANSIPGPGAPAGVEWAFTLRDRTFLAEGFREPQGTAFRYVLFEKVGDKTHYLRHDLQGRFDTFKGVMDIYVPLQSISAQPGTRITGAGEGDVDVHFFAQATVYMDTLTTTRGYVVPR